jgi:hypothetical protein
MIALSIADSLQILRKRLIKPAESLKITKKQPPETCRATYLVLSGHASVCDMSEAVPVLK